MHYALFVKACARRITACIFIVHRGDFSVDCRLCRFDLAALVQRIDAPQDKVKRRIDIGRQAVTLRFAVGDFQCTIQFPQSRIEIFGRVLGVFAGKGNQQPLLDAEGACALFRVQDQVVYRCLKRADVVSHCLDRCLNDAERACHFQHEQGFKLTVIIRVLDRRLDPGADQIPRITIGNRL